MATKAKTKKNAPKKITENDEEKVVSEKEVKDVPSEIADNMTKDEIKQFVNKKVEEAVKEQEENNSDTVEAKVTENSEGKETPSSETKEPSGISSEEKSSDETSKPNETPAVTVSSVEPPTIVGLPTDTSSESKSGANTEAITSSTTPVAPSEAPETDAAPASTSPVIGISGSPTLTGGGAAILSEDKKPHKKSPLILLFIVFVICGFVVGISVLFVLSKNNFKIPTMTSVTSILNHAPTPTPTLVVTPTPATADIAKYKISVLNGSGVAGAAAKEKDDLTTAGFTVDSTGNAPTSTADTTVAAKSTVDAVTLDKLVQTLNANYTVSSQTLSLGASESEDIVVTIGKAK